MTNIFRLALPVIAIGQFAGSWLQQSGLGQDIGARTTANGIPPELPPGLFFAIIWSVIFLLYLAYAVLAVRNDTYTHNHLATPLALAGLGNIVWMISATFVGNVFLDFTLLFPIIAAAWWAAYRLDVMGGFDGTGGRLLAAMVIGLLSGWLSAAVSVGGTDAVREALGLGVTDRVWSMLSVTLGIAGTAAFLFSRYISHSLWFFVALGWGILGVVVNNLTRTDLTLLGYVAAAVGVWFLYRRLTFGADGARA